MSTAVKGLCWPDVLPVVSPKARPDDWFAQSHTPQHARAMAICAACPLMEQCRVYGLTEGFPDGVFGGMTGPERRMEWGPAGPPKDHLAGLYSHLDSMRHWARHDDTEDVA